MRYRVGFGNGAQLVCEMVGLGSLFLCVGNGYDQKEEETQWEDKYLRRCTTLYLSLVLRIAPKNRISTVLSVTRVNTSQMPI